MMCIAGVANGKRGAFPGGRATRTWDAGGARGGARQIQNGESGPLGLVAAPFRSESSGSERVRRGGAAGSKRALGGSVARGGAEALPFAGSGLVVGRVGPLGRRQRGLGVPASSCWVLDGGRESSPPSMDLPHWGVAPG